MKKLTKEEIMDMTASALLELVASVVVGPVGIALPIIGNVVLNMKSTLDLKDQINLLEEKQQNTIKEELEKFYNIHIERQENTNVEIYSIDVVEMFFRTELSDVEMKEINQSLSYYRDQGVCYGDEEYANDNTDAPIDTYYVYADSVVFNLLEAVYREDVQLLIEDMDGILKNETHFNRVKKIRFY